jgi:hypothetical protein
MASDYGPIFCVLKIVLPNKCISMKKFIAFILPDMRANTAYNGYDCLILLLVIFIS